MGLLIQFITTQECDEKSYKVLDGVILVMLIKIKKDLELIKSFTYQVKLQKLVNPVMLLHLSQINLKD